MIIAYSTLLIFSFGIFFIAPLMFFTYQATPNILAYVPLPPLKHSKYAISSKLNPSL